MDLPAKSAREPIFNVPAVVVGLAATLGIIHLAMALLPADDADALLDLFAFDPLRYSGSGPVWPGGWAAGAWSFVTYAFFHFNVIHLGFNLIWLIVFGTPVARRFGAWRFLVFFAFTAAAGALAHLVTHLGQNVPAIGASAAVLGMMAAALRFVFQPEGPLDLIHQGEADAYRVAAKPLAAMVRDRRMLLFVVAWFGLNALMALPAFAMPGIDAAVAWQAHIGGFIAGLVGFAAFDPAAPLPPAHDEVADAAAQTNTPQSDDQPPSSSTS